MASSGLKHLVLVGLGMAHAQVLKAFASKRSVSLKITVINPSSTLVQLDAVPGFVAGHFDASHCAASLDDLLQRCGANLVKANVVALETATRQLTLSNGAVLTGDLISVNTEAAIDRNWLNTKMPGAAQHALNLHPLEAFCSLWPQVAQLATTRPLNVAVVGEHMVAVELALAVQHALATQPEGQPCRVSLVTGGDSPASDCAGPVQKRVLARLKQQHITVLRDRCVGMNGQELLLGSGARLVCDAPLLAMAGQAPSWWGNSGLAQEEAAGDPTVYLTPDTSANSSLAVGQALASALRAAIEDTPPRPARRAITRPRLFFFGAQEALMTVPTPWGHLCMQGRWLLPLKQQRDAARLKASIE